MKFIHCADIHLDSPMLGLEQYEGTPVEEIRDATRRAFEEIVRLALDEPADFVLIAGDLYDRDLEDFNTAIFFGRQMAKLEAQNIPVLLISGNHDAESKITKKLRMLPKNVKVFSSTKPESHCLTDLEVVVHGQSFPKGAVPQDLAAGYPQRHVGRFNIGLLHTSLMGSTEHDPYAPTTIDVLRSKGYDDWALGHIHQRQVVCSDPHIIYCGNPQGRHVREAGEKTCELVEVNDGIVSGVAPHVTSQVLWHRLSIDATDAETSTDVFDRAEQHLRAVSTDNRPHCIRIEIVGCCSAHSELVLNPVRTENELRQCAANAGDRLWVERVLLRTSAPINISATADAGPIAEIEQVIEAAKCDSAALQQLASSLKHLDDKLPPELKEGADKISFADKELLAGLLDDAAAELIASLSKGGGR